MGRTGARVRRGGRLLGVVVALALLAAPGSVQPLPPAVHLSAPAPAGAEPPSGGEPATPTAPDAPSRAPDSSRPRAAPGREPPGGTRPPQARRDDTAADDVPTPPEGAGIPAPGARYAWPLLPVPAIGARFRAPPHPFGRGHRGVDLVGAAGQPVLAARAGTVVFAGSVGGRSVVSVDHDDGLRTTYEPLLPAVRPGAVVAAGDVLGSLEPGHPGCSAAACLHWGVRRGPREYLDPLVLVRPPEVRLLPVPDPWPARAATALSPPRAPPSGRAAARPTGCAAGTPATR